MLFRELQIFLQIIGSGRELHTLVGLSYSDGIDLSHAHKLGKGPGGNLDKAKLGFDPKLFKN